MLLDAIQTLQEDLRTSNPEAHQTLFPNPGDAFSTFCAWRDAGYALLGKKTGPEAPYGTLAAWLLWAHDRERPLLMRLNFYSKISESISASQFWNIDCTVAFTRAILAVPPRLQKQLARRVVTDLRSKARQYHSDTHADWRRAFFKRALDQDTDTLLPLLLDAAAGHSNHPPQAELALLHHWSQHLDTLWPQEHDQTLIRAVAQERQQEADVDAFPLLKQLSAQRLQAIWQAAPKVHGSFVWLRDNPTSAVAALTQITALPCDVAEPDAVARQLAILLQDPPLSRAELLKAAQDPTTRTAGTARGLRLVADDSCTEALCWFLGTDPSCARDAARALGALGLATAGPTLERALGTSAAQQPPGVHLKHLRSGAITVARIWMETAPADTQTWLKRWSSTLSKRSSARSDAQNMIAADHTPQPWFTLEERLWRQTLHRLSAQGATTDQTLPPDGLLDTYLRVRQRTIGWSEFSAAIDNNMDHELAAAITSALLLQYDTQHWHMIYPIGRTTKALGTPLIQCMTHMLRHSSPKQGPTFYKWLCQLGGDDHNLHLSMLGHTNAELRKQAHSHITQNLDAQMRAGLMAQLAHSRASARTAAANALATTGDPNALPELIKALDREKSAQTRGALQQAIAACTVHTTSTAALLGVSDPRLAPSVNALLEELRDLLHDPEATTIAAWTRTCDLLERLRQLPDGLVLALDGMLAADPLPAVFNQPHSHRPWNWKGDPALGKLGRAPNDTPWIPFSAFCDATQREAFFNARLPVLEEGRRRRKLDPARATTLFTQAVQRGWTWCQTHHLPPHHLEIRVDSGMAGKMARSTPITALKLFHGFGVTLMTDVAGRTSGGSNHTQMRHALVSIPKHHVLRHDPKFKGQISRQGMLHI